jgi:diguanylate cyclase (GGDEF)-like protein
LTKDEVKLLSIIGSRIGMILENDRTFKKVKHNAITDGLTGLYNHYQFYTRLKLEIEKAKAENYQLFLLMIDIDRFKSFNDQFGHMIGDQVLSEVAKTIQSNIRETDIAARYGGEEFTIILPNCTYEMAAVVADRIRYNIKKVGEKIDTLKGKDIIVTASIGIACYPNCTNDLSNLIDIADVRMYKGKEMGGDKVIV